MKEETTPNAVVNEVSEANSNESIKEEISQENNTDNNKESQEINLENTGEKHVALRDERGRLLPGQTANPKGKPKGSTHFAVDFKRAIKKIADKNNITVDEAMDLLHRVGYNKAKQGDFNFWKQVIEMTYGKPKLPLEHSGEIDLPGAKELASALANVLNENDTQTEESDKANS